MQERALSTLAFLVTSPANTKIIVASNGVAVLVPLLGARNESVVTAASGILRRLLPLPSGQACSLPTSSIQNTACSLLERATDLMKIDVRRGVIVFSMCPDGPC